MPPSDPPPPSTPDAAGAAERAGWEALHQRGSAIKTEAEAWIADAKAQLRRLNERLDDLVVDDGTRQRVSDDIGVGAVLQKADEIADVLDELFAINYLAIAEVDRSEHGTTLGFLAQVPSTLRLQVTAANEDISKIVLAIDRTTTVVGPVAVAYQRLLDDGTSSIGDQVGLAIVSGVATLRALIDRLQSSAQKLADAAPRSLPPGDDFL